MTARAGEGVVLRCDVIHPVTGQPPPYVVEWFKFGVPIPIFIKFGYYPPHVDPEYAGKVWAAGGCPHPCFLSWFLLSVVMVLVTVPLAFLLPLIFLSGLLSFLHSLCLFPPIVCTLVGFN